MAQNMSENISEICTPKINFEYVELLYFSAIVTVVTALYYLCYCRSLYGNFPSCSLEFFIINMRVTGRYLGNLPITTALFTFLIALFKYFEKDGLCIVWLVKPHLVIFHERYTKILLNNEAALDKPITYDIISDMVGNSLLTINALGWKQCKKTLSPVFRLKQLKDTVVNLNKHAEDVVTKLAKERNKSSIDILPMLKMSIVKTLCETILDAKINDEDDEKISQYIQAVSSLGTRTVDRCVYFWLWWKHSLLFFTEGRNLLKLYAEFRGFTKMIIRRMKSNSVLQHAKIRDGGKDEKILLYTIFNEKFTKDPSFTMKDAEDAVNTLLFAGHDTTSYAVLWCLFMLGHHPDIQEKALEEIGRVAKHSTAYISYQDLKDLKYLECIIKETLRLYPSVPFFARRTTSDVTFGKYAIPKNFDVYVITYLLHRNPDTFPDPEKFDPERFNGKSLKHPWAYIPFSEGMRSCIGKTFAMMQMKILLAHILKNFEITSLDKREDIWLDVKIVLTPMTPIRLQFTPRENILLSDA